MLDWNLKPERFSHLCLMFFLCVWKMLLTFSWNDTQNVIVLQKKRDTVAVSCWKSEREGEKSTSDDIHCDSWQKNMCSSLKRVPRKNGNPRCRHACTLFHLRPSSPSHSVKASRETGGRVCIAAVSLSVLLLIYTHTGRVKAPLTLYGKWQIWIMRTHNPTKINRETWRLN